MGNFRKKMRHKRSSTVGGVIYPHKPNSLTLIDMATSKEYWKLLDSSKVSDCVVIKSEDQINRFFDLLDIKSKTKGQIPADLFFSNTVPLKDFFIEDNIVLPGFYVRYTVDSEALDNLSSLIKSINEAPKPEDPKLKLGMNVAIVSIINRSSKAELAFPILISPGVDYALVAEYVAARRPGHKYDTNLDEEAVAYFKKVAFFYLGMWYVIQLLLLHPDAKEVLVPENEDSDQELTDAPANRPFRRPYVTHNVRRVRINHNLIFTKSKARDWHVSSWYCIGFWRRAYGKLTFVQGHWKHRHYPTTGEEIPTRERIVE